MANENPGGDLGKDSELQSARSTLMPLANASGGSRQVGDTTPNDWEGDTDITNPNIQSLNHHHPTPDRPKGR